MDFLSLATLCLATTALASPHQQAPLVQPVANHGPSHDSAKASAPQIFNALHSSMRQWGSSLNHNGLSFFAATIPVNTDFYHGRGTPEPVTGTEWLAFEIEHAEVFARNRGFGGPGGPGGRPDRPGQGPQSSRDKKEEKRSGNHGILEEKGTAALHHYRTSRDLRVLFLDGMSAGKTSLGTLDQQDYILCEGTAEGFETKLDRTIAAGPPGDSQRASQMCDDFAHDIDGIVRMEAGFELILCNFTSGVDFISATPRPKPDTPESKDELSQFEYLRGISMRYHGITAGRVQVDYSSMVSAYFYNVNLTNPDEKHSALPRLVSSDKKTLQSIKSDVAKMLSTKNKERSIDWQGVVDMITTRYSDRLQFMALDSTSRSALASEINFLLTAFIDYSTPSVNVPLAIEKCATHYLSGLPLHTKADQLLNTAVTTITNKICSTLFQVRGSVLDGGTSQTDEEAKEKINELIKYLNWSTWLECGKCKYDEVCFVAIWPYGGPREHDSPECVKNVEVQNRKGYWGDRGPGGRPGGPGGPGGHDH